MGDSPKALSRDCNFLLLMMAMVLIFGHGRDGGGTALASGGVQLIAGVAAGFIIGVVASLLGVAGGELLIPTLVLVFGVDIKLAGSLSLAISFPTMIVGFTRCSRDQSFSILKRSRSLPRRSGGIVKALRMLAALRVQHAVSAAL